jgi:hypothetical protein
MSAVEHHHRLSRLIELGHDAADFRSRLLLRDDETRARQRGTTHCPQYLGIHGFPPWLSIKKPRRTS